jgi:HPt (histidine-containing phosphotransfer) domain-containing protein
MNRLCEAGDWENLKKVAHSAKGAAAQIGACKVSGIAMEIESEAKVDILKQHRIKSLLERLESVMAETFTYLAREK